MQKFGSGINIGSRECVVLLNQCSIVGVGRYKRLFT